MILFILCIIIWLFIYFENNFIKTTFFEVSSEKLTFSFEGYTIVQISDLHSKRFGQNQYRLLENIKRQYPDIIVITGDIIYKRKFSTDNAVEFIKGAVKIAPVYFVTGNHEATIKDKYKILYEKLIFLGVKVLENESIELFTGEDSIFLCGINDPCFENKDSKLTLENIVQKNLSHISLNSEKFNILLSHRPEMIKIYSSYGYDLVFTGHAHGGQFRIPFIGGLFAPNQGFFPKYTSGSHLLGKTTEIISRGLGHSIIPLRIFNRPELVVCKLRSTNLGV